MAVKWINATRGVRYREHEPRKHNKRPDRYYVLQYKHKGKVYNESIGWASDGVTLAKCEAELANLKLNWHNGEGGQTIKEIREKNLMTSKKESDDFAKKQALTLGAIFNSGYLSQQKTKRRPKSEITIQNEISMLNNYILPYFADTPLSEIDSNKMDKFLLHLLSVKSLRTGKNLSASTRTHIINLISQIFNYAITRKLGENLENPIKFIEKPMNTNQRQRWLKPHEAKRLLDALFERSVDTHDIAKIALFTGMRQAEILNLTWENIDRENKVIFLSQTKSGKTRYVYMTEECLEVLNRRYDKQAFSEKVFKTNALSKTFDRTVKQLGFNDNIDNPLNKVCFHTLRHTFASWQVQSGKSLFEVAGLLGHSSDAMTQRYSHLCPDKLQKATQSIEGILELRVTTIDFIDKVGQKV